MKNADSEVSPIKGVINKHFITMSFTKILIAASHAIGAAVMLSLVVPEVPADVYVDDRPTEVEFSAAATTRELDEPFRAI